MKLLSLPEQDTLPLTLFLALAVHSFLILGITFDYQDQRYSPPDRTLEITVVRHPNKPKNPEKADFFAQTSQEGGGNEERVVKPKTEIAPPSVKPEEQQAQASPPTGDPTPTRQKELLASENPTKPLTKPKQQPSPNAAKAPKLDLFSQRDMEIQRLSAELDAKREAYAKRPRTKQITAATQEYKYAAYHQAWKSKVENIGTLNFPDEAKRQRLYGNLILLVALKKDGSIERIELRKSSGHKVLDDAAIQIVRLGAPYAPFPPDIAKETDVMEIIRTWQFLTGNRLLTGQ